MNVFVPVVAVLFALVVSQGYFAMELLRNSSRLHAMEAEAAALRDQMAPVLEEVRRKRPEIEADQQMAVDLTRALVQVADEGSETAKALLPAIRQDLQQLQLRISLGSGADGEGDAAANPQETGRYNPDPAGAPAE